jgi:CYTH domain-containing protein
MVEGGAEKSGKQKEAPHARLERFPTLVALVEGGEGVNEEYEAERRFLPARTLSEAELTELSGGASLYITQVYVDAGSSEKNFVFRLRITETSGGAPLLRIAYKRKTPSKAREERIGRIERQVVFDERDPRSVEFNALFNRRRTGWHTLYKTRYYIPLTLPNGNTAEIHYDVHHGPPETLDGYHRIEIELHGTPGDTGESVEADAAFLATPEGRAVLPDWVGEDVTGKREYGSKRLARYGSVEKAREALASRAQKEN